MSVVDLDLKTYVTIHLPMVLSTFFDSSQVPGLLKIQVSCPGKCTLINSQGKVGVTSDMEVTPYVDCNKTLKNICSAETPGRFTSVFVE